MDAIKAEITFLGNSSTQKSDFSLNTMRIIFAAATAPPSLRPPPPDSSRWAWRRPCHVGQQFPGSRPPLCRKITRLAQSLLDNHLAENVAYHNLKWSPGRHKKKLHSISFISEKSCILMYLIINLNSPRVDSLLMNAAETVVYTCTVLQCGGCTVQLCCLTPGAW